MSFDETNKILEDVYDGLCVLPRGSYDNRLERPEPEPDGNYGLGLSTKEYMWMTWPLDGDGWEEDEDEPVKRL